MGRLAHTPICLNMVWKRSKGPKRRGVHFAFGVVHAVRYHLVTKCIASTRHQMGVQICLVMHKIHGRIDQLVKRVGHVVCNATPEILRLERLHGDRGHDPKIVETAFEGDPEIRPFVGICVDHFA